MLHVGQVTLSLAVQFSFFSCVFHDSLGAHTPSGNVQFLKEGFSVGIPHSIWRVLRFPLYQSYYAVASDHATPRIVHYHLKSAPPGSPEKHKEKEDKCTASDNTYAFEPPRQSNTPMVAFCKRLQHRSPPLETVRKSQWTEKPRPRDRRLHHHSLAEQFSSVVACMTLWHHTQMLIMSLYISSSVCMFYVFLNLTRLV